MLHQWGQSPEVPYNGFFRATELSQRSVADALSDASAVWTVARFSALILNASDARSAPPNHSSMNPSPPCGERHPAGRPADGERGPIPRPRKKFPPHLAWSVLSPQGGEGFKKCCLRMRSVDFVCGRFGIRGRTPQRHRRLRHRRLFHRPRRLLDRSEDLRRRHRRIRRTLSASLDGGRVSPNGRGQLGADDASVLIATVLVFILAKERASSFWKRPRPLAGAVFPFLRGCQAGALGADSHSAVAF